MFKKILCFVALGVFVLNALSADLPKKFRELQELCLSGSAQFDPKDFGALKQHLDKRARERRKIIIDLRLESHGFINNEQIAWDGKYRQENKGKSVPEILSSERKLLSKQLGRKVNGNKVVFVLTEQDLVRSHQCDYVRMPIGDDDIPSRAQVENFLKLVRDYPDAWFHFHCTYGKGRTTLFMVMLEIIKKADRSLEEILHSHHAMGGEDFHSHDAICQKRLHFLGDFYNSTFSR